MSIYFYIVIVGFLDTIAVHGTPVDQKSNSRGIQAQQSPTLFNFNETQSELVKQAPLNKDTGTELKTKAERTLSTITKNQKELVKQFHLVTKELRSDQYFRSDNFVLGLLSRNNWNIPVTVKYFKRILKWRHSNNVPELGTSGVDPEMLKLFPYSLDTADRNGCPVLECPMGRWLMADYMESKEFVRDALKSFDVYTTQVLENTRLAKQKRLDTCNDGVIMVVDATGFSVRNFAEANALNAAVHTATVMDSYYPNLFNTIIFINANQDLAKFLTILTPYFGQIVSHFKVFNYNETETAYNFVDKLMDPEKLTF